MGGLEVRRHRRHCRRHWRSRGLPASLLVFFDRSRGLRIYDFLVLPFSLSTVWHRAERFRG